MYRHESNCENRKETKSQANNVAEQRVLGLIFWIIHRSRLRATPASRNMDEQAATTTTKTVQERRAARAAAKEAALASK